MKSGEKIDTLFIPNDKVAKIDFNKNENTTSVYLYDNGWDTWAAYQPWYASSWYSWHYPYYSSIYWAWKTPSHTQPPLQEIPMCLHGMWSDTRNPLLSWSS